MNTRVFRSLIWLIDTMIKNPKGLTLRELKQLWDNDRYVSEKGPLSKSYFYRAIDRVFDNFGVIIEGYRFGRECKFRIVNHAWLETDSIALWFLDNLRLVKNMSMCVSMNNRFKLEHIPCSNFFTEIVDAMNSFHYVTISYHKYGTRSVEQRTFQPYGMVQYLHRWYVLAFFPNRKEHFRTYSLDRITEFRKEEETFIMPKDFDIHQYFEDDFGLVNDTSLPVERVVLRAFGTEAQYIRDCPLHHSQTVLATHKEYTDFELHVRTCLELQGYILSRGNRVKVLHPTHFKRQIQEVLLSSAALYDDAEG